MFKKLWNIFPFFELFMLTLPFLVLLVMVIFYFPLNEGLISPDVFGCGTIMAIEGKFVVLVNEAGMRLIALDNNDGDIGQSWTIEIVDGKYVLKYPCD